MLLCLGPHSAQHYLCTAQDWGATFQKGAQVEKLQRTVAGRAQKQHWGISALPGDYPPLQFLLALSALQAMKVSHVSGSCPKRWNDVAAERAAWRTGSGCPFLRERSQADHKVQATITTALCTSGLGQSRGNKV